MANYHSLFQDHMLNFYIGKLHSHSQKHGGKVHLLKWSPPQWLLTPPMTSNGRVCLVLDRQMRPGLNGKEQSLTNQKAWYCVRFPPLLQSLDSGLIMHGIAKEKPSSRLAERAHSLSLIQSALLFCGWGNFLSVCCVCMHCLCVRAILDGFVSVDEADGSP